MHYFSNEEVKKFVEKVENTISEFIKKHGYTANAKIIVPLGTFEPLVDSDELKTKNGMIECAEDENGWDGYIERQLRFLVRRNKQGAYIFQEDKMMRIAAELQLNYGL